jgi:HK97 family phage prohead protease
MSNIERRYGVARWGVEERKAGGGLPRLVGYAAVFYDRGDPAGTELELSTYVERIAPGAFSRTIREDDVRALFNHDADNLLGRTRSRTLRLSVDSRGLRYEIDLPDTTVGRQVAALVRRWDVTGSSFAFDTRDYREYWEGSTRIRELTDVKLYDVGPVTFPAYTGTTAGVRAELSAAAQRDQDLIALTLALFACDLAE